jgi:hypothetical protein
MTKAKYRHGIDCFLCGKRPQTPFRLYWAVHNKELGTVFQPLCRTCYLGLTKHGWSTGLNYGGNFRGVEER